MQEGIGREKMESIKHAENMAEMFGSNTPESPTSRVVVVKTERIQRDKRAFPFFFFYCVCVCVFPPPLCTVWMHCSAAHLVFYLIFFFFVSQPRGHL